MVNHFNCATSSIKPNNIAKRYIMNTNNKPIWGMAHQFNVLVLWGRETANSYEQVLGEFSTLEQVKAFATEHHQAHSWASYRVGAI